MIEVSDESYEKIMDNLSKMIKENGKPYATKDSLNDLLGLKNQKD